MPSLDRLLNEKDCIDTDRFLICIHFSWSGAPLGERGALIPGRFQARARARLGKTTFESGLRTWAIGAPCVSVVMVLQGLNPACL